MGLEKEPNIFSPKNTIRAYVYTRSAGSPGEHLVMYLSYSPWPKTCLAAGRTIGALDEPERVYESLYWDLTNYQSCSPY